MIRLEGASFTFDHQKNIAGEGEFIDQVLSTIKPIVGDGFLSD